MIILDISSKSSPKMISRWDNSPPYDGFTHTVLPLFERGLLVVTDEALREDGRDWPKLLWVVDGRDESNPVPIATCPAPTPDMFKQNRRRMGVHNIHENVPTPYSWHSDRIIVGTFFCHGLSRP